MSKDFTKNIKLSLRILNEYRLRYIAKTESLENYLKHMNTVCSYVRSAEGAPNISDKRKAVHTIDLLLDFLAFDEFGSGNIDNSQEEWGTSVDKKIRRLTGNVNYDNVFNWFLLSVDTIRKQKSVYNALLYLYNLSVKHRVYATHIALLDMKSYPLGNDYSELKFLNSLEPNFWRITGEAPAGGDYLSLSPHEVESICGITPTEEGEEEDDHLFKGKYAFLVNVAARKIDIGSVCQDIPQKLIAAYIQHKLDKVKPIPISENDWLLYKKYHPTVSDADYEFGNARNRALGLVVWDMIHFGQSTVHKAHAELLKTSSIYGYRTTCARAAQKKKSCSGCEDTRGCRNQIRDSYDVAVASVNLGRIVRTSEREEIKKQKNMSKI